MRAILVNYNFDPVWLKDYPEIEPIIYDRSDDGVERNLPQYGLTLKTQNLGDVDFDKLAWLVENYDTLPEVFLWGKTNLFKFVDELTFKEALKKNVFTPLIRPDHKIYSDRFGQVNSIGCLSTMSVLIRGSLTQRHRDTSITGKSGVLILGYLEKPISHSPQAETTF